VNGGVPYGNLQSMCQGRLLTPGPASVGMPRESTQHRLLASAETYRCGGGGNRSREALDLDQ